MQFNHTIIVPSRKQASSIGKMVLKWKTRRFARSFSFFHHNHCSVLLIWLMNSLEFWNKLKVEWLANWQWFFFTSLPFRDKNQTFMYVPRMGKWLKVKRNERQVDVWKMCAIFNLTINVVRLGSVRFGSLKYRKLINMSAWIFVLNVRNKIHYIIVI